MSLRVIEADLRSLLRAHQREDIARDALGRVAYTDDGSTLYVHVLPNQRWPLRRAGQAYVLAFADKDRLRTLGDFRDLLHEARLRLHDDIEDLIRWFDGR